MLDILKYIQIHCSWKLRETKMERYVLELVREKSKVNKEYPSVNEVKEMQYNRRLMNAIYDVYDTNYQQDCGHHSDLVGELSNKLFLFEEKYHGKW